MSYGSFIKSLSQALRQPTGIASIASVGLHGLLWIVLPILPLASKTTESEAQRSVQVVELTPAEQSRLPSFATPQLSLPPLPQTTNLFPSLPSLQSSNSLPSSNSSPYSLPLFPPPPTGFSFSPPMPLPGPLGLPTTQIPIPDPPPRPPQSTQRPPLSGEFQERPGLDAIQQNSQALQSQTLPQLPQLEASAPESINFPPTDPNLSESETPPSQPPSNSPEATSPPATTQPSPSETEQAAAPTAPPSAPGPRPDKIPAAAIARLREAQERQQEFYARDSEGTTREGITGNLEVWARQALEKTGKDWKPLEVTPSYPPEVCSRKPEGSASLGVVVDADGKLTDDPVLIQGTGFSFLNQRAEEVLNAYEFEQTGESQAYLVTLPFTYDSETCNAAPAEEAPPS
uniref:TonB family protein n=1 Tax=Trichocoleus desertorum TaxID=1481672 RepID=UPI0025B2D9F5|nr:TonB family protein [Trichocoleus desertorum]